MCVVAVKKENVLPLQIGVEGSVMDYPYATCCSLNDEVAHAFPRHYTLKDGDLLKLIWSCQNLLTNPFLMYQN